MTARDLTSVLGLFLNLPCDVYKAHGRRSELLTRNLEGRAKPVSPVPLWTVRCLQPFGDR